METLRNSLNEIQSKQLNQLLDSINKDDSAFSYEAFYKGVLLGMIESSAKASQRLTGSMNKL